MQSLSEKTLYRMYWMKVWGLTSPEISKVLGIHWQTINKKCREMGLFFPIGVYPRARLKLKKPIGRPTTDWQVFVKLTGSGSELKMWDSLYPDMSFREIADYFWKEFREMISSQTIRNRLIGFWVDGKDRKIRLKGGPNNVRFTVEGMTIKDFLLSNRDRWASMTIPEICEKHGLLYRTVHLYLFRLGIPWKRLRKVYNYKQKTPPIGAIDNYDKWGNLKV